MSDVVTVWAVHKSWGSQMYELVSAEGNRTAKIVKIRPGRAFGYRTNLRVDEVDYSPEAAKARAAGAAEAEVLRCERLLAAAREAVAAISRVELPAVTG